MTKPIILYINSLTVNSIKMLLISRALNLNVEFRYIALNKAEHKTDFFIAINPEGKVPVLVDQDFVLTQSNSILQYLAAKHNSSLWPSDLKSQASILKILFWQSSYFNSSVGVISHRLVVLPHWGVKASKIDEVTFGHFHHAIAVLEKILSKTSAVAGEKISIADISIASYLMFAKQSHMPLEKYPAVLAWLTRLKKLNWFSQTQSELNNVLSSVAV
ncbi:MAG: glutathione S-transferase family protein [Saccharospirillaceae bacterium]|nr:glutathione S-transferase family protein [Pseudomonadales bacterium]NRB80524.1 glutathione S-transferase family protein [Saccharospirillaceae bacterium]